jgi:hypothetical protein
MERLLRRSHATGLRWVALSLVGLSVAAACSDDSSEAGPGPDGKGGEGGENAAGNGATAGTAGTPATGGTAVNMTGGAGAATAGEGGMGGVPPVITVGEQCTTCGASECADTLTSCSASPDCTDWLACVTACDSSDCIAACDAGHVDAVRVYTDVYACLCTSCKADCTDAGACEKKTCVDDNPLPITDVVPATLAETGLYAVIDGGDAGGAGGGGGAPGVELAMPIKLASYVRDFEPKYPLWADGATKDRYAYIPKCSTIDTTDMDHWRFPVGTRFWKTFNVSTGVGATQAAVETRMLHHFGPGEADWMYATYQWDVNKPGDPTAALSVAAGVVNANGTTHDIPPESQCRNCHSISEKVLSFGAIQLSHAGKGLTIEKLSNLGWLTQPAPEGFEVPGTAVQQAALGYLHGNCGGCHHQAAVLGAGADNGNKPLVVRLLTGQKTYDATDTVKSTVGVIVGSAIVGIDNKPRIAAMTPAESAILIRMGARTAPLQMPPFVTSSTKVADTDGGIKAVTDWVNSIPQ